MVQDSNSVCECAGCPKKSRVLHSSLNFEKYIKQQNEFKSVFIKLSLDMLFMKLERMSHSYGTLIDCDWKFLKLR